LHGGIGWETHAAWAWIASEEIQNPNAISLGSDNNGLIKADFANDILIRIHELYPVISDEMATQNRLCRK
jgi:hypothetical protein